MPKHKPKLDFVRKAVARRICDERAGLERAILSECRERPELVIRALYQVAFLRHG